jgi:branched-chain amino acid aminotransferase
MTPRVLSQRPLQVLQHVAGVRSISSANLTITKVQKNASNFDKRPAKQDLVFGTTLSDHMLMIEWNKDTKWSDPRIVPYADLKISPAASCLHYGLQCFEGMKAYKGHGDRSLRLFRPDMNMKRLASSMDRLHMPGADFDHKELTKCISELVKLDSKWIPSGEGYSLYLRPTVIATQRVLGLAPPDSILLYVISSPVGPYYKSGFKPIRLTTDTPYVRAWPGGSGNTKVGGNYAPTMKPQGIAAKAGYAQILWLWGDEITEVGAMNVFFFLVNKETKRKELVTAPLTRGDILPGVTRDSILHLTRSWGDFDVSERFLTMGELKEAAEDGRLIEAFGAGTAAVVTPIEAIQYKGKDIEVPVGTLTKRIWDAITGIQYGKTQGPEGWSVTIGEISETDPDYQ